MKVTLGLFVYNESPYILDTLESIRAQAYEDFTVLISDNASTDGTGEICREFCRQDKRFDYVRQPGNIGAHANHMYVLRSLESEYGAVLGGHDLIEPTFLAKHVAALDDNPDVSLSYSFTRWIDGAGGTVSYTDGGDYIMPPETGPADRYFNLARILSSCECVNQVFRRKWLIDLRVRPVVGYDHVVLGHLVGHGPFHRIEEHLFVRRHFPPNKRMEKITGKDGQSADFLDLAMDYINDVRNHAAIPEKDKPGLIWLLLKVIQERWRPFDIYGHLPVAE